FVDLPWIGAPSRGPRMLRKPTRGAVDPLLRGIRMYLLGVIRGEHRPVVCRGIFRDAQITKRHGCNIAALTSDLSDNSLQIRPLERPVSSWAGELQNAHDLSAI